MNGKVWVAPCPDKHEGLVHHAHESWAILGSDRPLVCPKHNIGGKGCNFGFNNLFFNVLYDIKYKLHQHTYTSSSTITYHGVWLLV
jgi:hypothetical protein